MPGLVSIAEFDPRMKLGVKVWGRFIICRSGLTKWSYVGVEG